MRGVVVVVALAILTSCGIRETKEQIKNVGGHNALCSWTHNKISGNDSEETCIPVATP